LKTDPNGFATGSIHGQLFVGRSFGPGAASGTLNGRPYDIRAGIAPDPTGPLAFAPPPPVILAQPSPADDWRPAALPAPPAP
jgi:hypothetical protein